MPIKRTIFLCAFLVSGCSDNAPSPESQIPSSDLAATTTITEATNNATEQVPLLTISELLNAADVKQALAEASATDNQQSLRKWQTILLNAADEVNLDVNERRLISGANGLKYLAFQGMKSNYQAAFEQAFVAFEDVDAVYRDYPAFEQLHQRSSELVAQRDALVASVAEQLVAEGFTGNALEEAKRQWRNYIVTQSSTESDIK